MTTRRICAILLLVAPSISALAQIPFYTQFDAKAPSKEATARASELLSDEAARLRELATSLLEQHDNTVQTLEFRIAEGENGDAALFQEGVQLLQDSLERLTARIELVSEVARIKEEAASAEADPDSPKSIAEVEKWYKEGAEAIRAMYDKEIDAINGLPNSEERNRMDKIALATREYRFDSLDAEERERIRRLVSMSTPSGSFWIHKTPRRRSVERYFEPYADNPGGFLQSSAFFLNTAKGEASLYSELYYDYFGPLRLGIGGQLSTGGASTDSTSAEEAQQETQEDLAQRVLGGGGNFMANLSLPLYAYNSKDAKFGFRFMFQPRFALDLQSINTDSTNVPYNFDIGPELYLNVTGSRGVISGFISWRPSMVIGAPSFYDLLDRGGYKPIEMNQVRFGVGIANVARISYTVVAGDDFVRDNFNSQISVQILTAGLGK